MDDLVPATDLAAKNTVRHPNETDAYRRARQDLLVEEIELRRHMERVAQLRRALPAGGEVPADYRFVAEDGREVSFADLFGNHSTLVVYSFMFGPQRANPCPMCTSFMGGFDHKIADISRQVAIAFVGRSPIERIIGYKQSRGWSGLPMFSDPSGDYTRAYVAADDIDVAGLNVFTRRDGTIRHFWADEIGFDMADPGQDPRSAVEMDPLWLVLDTTPEGRGTDWRPSLHY